MKGSPDHAARDHAAGEPAPGLARLPRCVPPERLLGADYGGLLRAAPPRLFRLAKFLQRRGRLGGNRLLEWAEARGRLDLVVRYGLPGGGCLDVPLWRRPTQWDEHDLARYEAPFLDLFAARLRSLEGPITLVDGGADIGASSVLVADRGAPLRRIVAYEPNGEVEPFLKSNLARLPGGEVRLTALAAAAGWGTIASPTYDASPHARYFTSATTSHLASPMAEGTAAGSLPIVAETVDDLGLGGDEALALKLDLEGGEFDALRGAAATLAAVSGFVVGFEAHPLAAARSGVDPVKCLRLLAATRPIAWQVAESPAKIDLERPFFAQLARPEIVNVVCWTL